jgi:phosphonoacetate hydrolase
LAETFSSTPSTGQEAMMNSSTFLRVDTVFPHAQRAGRTVAVVTAKEKLRDIFASGLIQAGGIAFSSERAGAAIPATHGIGGVESLVGVRPMPRPVPRASLRRRP